MTARKRSTKKVYPSTVNVTGKLVTMEKAEELNSFASVFNGNLSSHISQVDGLQGRDWRRKVPPSVREDQVHDCVKNLIVYKSMRHDKMHPGVLRELDDATTKPLSMIFEKCQSGEVPEDCKKSNTTPIF